VRIDREEHPHWRLVLAERGDGQHLQRMPLPVTHGNVPRELEFVRYVVDRFELIVGDIGAAENTLRGIGEPVFVNEASTRLVHTGRQYIQDNWPWIQLRGPEFGGIDRAYSGEMYHGPYFKGDLGCAGPLFGLMSGVMGLEKELERAVLRTKLRREFQAIAAKFGAESTDVRQAVMDLLADMPVEETVNSDVKKPKPAPKRSAPKTAPKSAEKTSNTQAFSDRALQIIREKPGLTRADIGAALYPGDNPVEARHKADSVLRYLSKGKGLIRSKDGHWHPVDSKKAQQASEPRKRRGVEGSVQSLVFETVKTSGKPVAAADILKAVREKKPGVNQVTVYGAASRMAQRGRLGQTMRRRFAFYSLPNGAR